MKFTSNVPLAAALSAACLVLSACGGTVGSQTSQSEGAGDGFDYDADQNEVDQLLSDLDPVTLNFQVPAPSPQADLAAIGTEFKEYVEDRSNGQITIDVVYGNAIASHTETPDALEDGRLDIAYAVTSYLPQDFPEIDAYNAAAGLITATPQLGVLVDTAVLIEQSVHDQALLDRFEERGITSMVPIFTPASNYLVCSDRIDDLPGLEGLQVRGGTSIQLDLIKTLGASGVDIEFTETYEALQRNTIDCTISGMPNAADGGVFEVAPYAAFPDGASIPGGNGSLMSGKTVADLPLAYQQIVYDGIASMVEGKMLAQVNGNASAFQTVADNGGEVLPLQDDASAAIADRLRELIDERIDAGSLPDDVVDQVAESEERWTSVFEDLGYEDGGSREDFGQWGERDLDYGPAAQVVFDELLVEHRPE